MIKININPESLRKSQRNSITGTVTIRKDNFCFPDDNWDDHIVVIFTWWIQALNNLKQGATEVVFRFMDGPFSLLVKRKDSNSFLLFFIRDEKIVSKSEIGGEALINELIKAATILNENCILRNWLTSDVRHLQKELSNFVSL